MEPAGRRSDDDLLAYSRGLLDRVSAHEDAFVADGLPPDFLKKLGDAIQGFAAARDAHAASRQRFTDASEMIRETQNNADKAVGILEAIVVNTPADQAEVLTKLRMAKRVGPRATAAVPENPAPTPAPPSTPTDKAA
jgi:hypothetical protein